MPKYRVKVGRHLQGRPERLYVRGDVFESNDQLIARDRGKFELVDPASKVSPGQLTGTYGDGPQNNSSNAPAPAPVVPAAKDVPPVVVPPSPAPADEKPLEEMTEKELREVAADEDIDVSKCKTKAELLKAVKAGIEG